jgi:CHAT domain-containing protein/Tfp pilus assembly protein PilF
MFPGDSSFPQFFLKNVQLGGNPMSLKPSSPLNRSESSVVVAWFWGTWWAALFLLLVVSPVVGQTASSTGNADSCGDVRPGIVVETVAKNSEAEKAGLAEGDVILAWTRGDVKGEIQSPFDVSEVEIEQEPKGQVTLSGMRGRVAQMWAMGPEKWGVETRPNLPESELTIYDEALELTKGDKLAEAAERWRTVSARFDKASCKWLDVWFFFHSANLRADSRQWQESDQLNEKAVELSTAVGPRIRTLLFMNWAYQLFQRVDLHQFGAMGERALDEALKVSKESLAVARCLNGLGVSLTYGGDSKTASDYLREALTMREKLAPGSVDVALSLNSLGELARVSGNLTLAQQYYTQALAIREKIAPGSVGYAGVLNNLGVIARRLGNFSEAESYSKHALAIQQQLMPGSLEVANSLNSLGNLALLQGDLQEAERYLVQSLTIKEALAPGSLSYAITSMNAGNVAHSRGDLAGADRYYQKALGIEQKLAPESTDIAMTLVHLGMDARERGDFTQAENYFNQSLKLTEKLAPGSLDLANSFDNLADLANSRSKVQEAEEYCRKALEIQQKVAPHSEDVANGLDFLAQIAFDRGDSSTAADYNLQARKLRKQLAPDSEEYAEALALQARLTQRRGALDEAAELYAQAIDVLDRQLTHLGGSTEVRAGFRAKQADYYSEYADLLAEQKKPEIAFEVLERSRARTLLEMLAGSHVDIRQGVDPASIEKERLLQATLTAKTNRKISLLEGEHTPEQLASVNRELDQALSEYQELEGQIRTISPKYAALTQPKPLRAKEAQQLLDTQTVLLDYSLGAKRSLVFVVTPTSLDSYELSKREEVENTARRTYDLLTVRNRWMEGETSAQRVARLAQEDTEYRKTSATLSQMVLGPVMERLEGKRLVIVADGALQYIPFASLPVPAGIASRAAVPLIADHEIISLPSASVLSLLRLQANERATQPKEVAILADPVFDKNDPRVGKTEKRTSAGNKEVGGTLTSESTEHLTRSIQDVSAGTQQTGVGLSRLAFSRREAAAIMAITKPGAGMEAVDFHASRETAMSKELSQYRIVHFATHGLLDNEHPELSGLVLSLVDAEGRPQDGFLDLQDVYNLTIPADLVVLSACETGLGKEISGEGLVGLTRGFMYAGASRVVASLWKVDDVATSELMAEFYKGMLQAGLPPAAALRQAQLEMQKRKRWADPYYWAAFTLQGEWK